jgi:hypothetical protein
VSAPLAAAPRGVDALAEEHARPSVDSEEAAEIFFRDAPHASRSVGGGLTQLLNSVQFTDSFGFSESAWFGFNPY